MVAKRKVLAWLRPAGAADEADKLDSYHDCIAVFGPDVGYLWREQCQCALIMSICYRMVLVSPSWPAKSNVKGCESKHQVQDVVVGQADLGQEILPVRCADGP